MRSYELKLPPDVSSALAALCNGVVRVGVTGRAKGLDGFFGCELELASGEIVSISADQHDLEYKFEVFPITAAFAVDRKATETQGILLCAPVEVLILSTQDWLDPGIPCEGAVGQNPVMQCQGVPASAPLGAPAACTYVGGVELRGSNGVVLRVATLPFPYAIHVSNFDGGGIFDPNSYIASKLGAE